MAKLSDFSATVPIGTAVVKLPDGQEIKVEVMPDKTMLQKLNQIVRALNGLP